MINIEKFRHIAIIVRDLQKMIEFYTHTLGFNIKRTFEIESDDFGKGVNIPDAKAKGTHLIHPNSNIEIELFEFINNSTPNNTPSIANAPGYRHIAFIVDDLEQSYKILEEKGMEFFSEPITVKEPKEVAGFKFVYFKDPEGNIIELNKLPENE